MRRKRRNFAVEGKILPDGAILADFQGALLRAMPASRLLASRHRKSSRGVTRDRGTRMHW